MAGGHLPRAVSVRAVTVRVEVVLVCDARRSRDCHGEYAKALGPWVLPGAEGRVRLEAPSTGWTREAGGRPARPARSQVRPSEAEGRALRQGQGV